MNFDKKYHNQTSYRNINSSPGGSEFGNDDLLAQFRYLKPIQKTHGDTWKLLDEKLSAYRSHVNKPFEALYWRGISPTRKYAYLTPDVLSSNKFKRDKDHALSPDSASKQMYNSFRKFNPGQYEENSPEWQIAMLQYLLDMKKHGHKVQEVSVNKVITITTYDLFCYEQ